MVKPAQVLRSLLAIMKRRRKLIVRAAAGGVVLTVLVIFAIPLISVEIGTRRAIQCLARYQAPHPPSERPSCEDHMQWFVRPSRISWTRHNATYRAEEFYARMAFFDYLDASVAVPNSARQKETAKRLLEVEGIVKKGSARHSMEDLGPSAIGAPNLGRAALLVSDQTTLLTDSERFSDWHVRLRVLHTALAQGNDALAFDIAKRFAVWDPSHEELRAAVAAMLCIGNEQARGIELLKTMQDDRAARRYAAMARNWGDIRALIVACAARKNIQPPPAPESPQAGQGDRVELRAVLRLKLLAASQQAAAPPWPDLSKEREEKAVEWASELLSLSPIELGTRLPLLAAVFTSKLAPKAADAVDMARVRPENGEAPLFLRTALSAEDWLSSPHGLRPVLSATTYERASEKLRALSDETELSADAAQTLRTAADALVIEAIKTLALSGRKEQALALLQTEAVQHALEHEGALGFARSTVLYLSGDHQDALNEIDAALQHFAKHENDSEQLFQQASALIQRAELLAALRPQEQNAEQAGQALAQAALIADEHAAKTESPWLDARARWLRLALVRAPHGQPLRPSSEVDLAHNEPSGRWPWVGDIPLWKKAPPQSVPSELLAQLPAPMPQESSLAEPWQGALIRLLARYHEAISASPEQRLAQRYQLLFRRGDSMPEPLAELSLATELLAGTNGDIEVWLNTYMARAAGPHSHRKNAWIRWHAARWRGDSERAESWKKIYTRLQSLAFDDPSTAELAAFLDL